MRSVIARTHVIVAVSAGLVFATARAQAQPNPSLPALLTPLHTPRLWYEAGLLTVDGEGLEAFQVVVVRRGIVVATAACVAGEGCAVTLPLDARDDLIGDPASWRIALLSAMTPVQVGQSLTTPWRSDGVGTTPADVGEGRIEVVLSEPLFSERSLDTARDTWTLVPRVASALDRVTCERVLCRRTEAGVTLLQPAPGAASVRLTYTLRPGFFRHLGGRLVQAETLTLRLERCAVIPPGWPLLAGVRHQRLPLTLPVDCVPARLDVQTSPPTGAWIRGEAEGAGTGSRVVEVRLDEVPRDIPAVTVTLLDAEGGRRIGSVRVPVSGDFVPKEVRIVVPELGPVGYIPSNRDAHIRFGVSDPVWFERLEVVDRPGFYRVRREQGGVVIRGEAGVAGSVPLRFAYHPAGSGPSGAMAFFDTDVVYSVRSVNVPLPLVADAAHRFFEVRCGPPGSEVLLVPGVMARLAYEHRDTCRLVFTLDRIPTEAGVQRLRVRAGDQERVLMIERAEGTLTVSVGAGDRREYDTLLVLVAHDMSGDHYALGAEQRLGEEARFRVLLSDDRVRISVTTSLPTGLFRFGRSGTGESVPLSAGALLRLAYVQQDGRDFPVTLEFGMFGTNLSGNAHLSIVSGLGLGIPVLNPDTAMQASFNIHTWFEYSPTRARAGQGGVAFVFGPSFTIGRISTTF